MGSCLIEMWMEYYDKSPKKIYPKKIILQKNSPSAMKWGSK